MSTFSLGETWPAAVSIPGLFRCKGSTEKGYEVYAGAAVEVRAAFARKPGGFLEVEIGPAILEVNQEFGLDLPC